MTEDPVLKNCHVVHGSMNRGKILKLGILNKSVSE